MLGALLIGIRRFLLARLHLESLADKTTIKAVKQALKALPRGEGALHHAYGETLTRIESQLPGFALLAKNTLMWLVYAKRELTIQELRCALAIEENSSELDADNLEDADEIITACKGLVILDHKTEIVRLVHFTTQQFLKTALPGWAPHAQERITRACLQYLSFRPIRSSLRGEKLKCLLSEHNIGDYVRAQCQDHILLRYVLGHCVSHARSCWNEAIENLFLEWFCDEQNLAIYLEDFAVMPRPWGVSFSRKNNTALHMSAVLDCEEITAKLLSDGKINVNAINDKGKTALHTAAQYGRCAIAVLLLGHDDIQINIQDETGTTPLILAARTGHEHVAISLARRDDILVNLQDEKCRTALHSAANQGFEALARLLLRRVDVQVNEQDKFGSTPLLCAVERSSQAIVELLLERDDTLLNLQSRWGNTALQTAVDIGQEAIVEILLKRDDIQVNLEPGHHESALISAAVPGRDTMVRLLLQRDDIQVNLQRSQSGRTALIGAASYGEVASTELLLQRDDVDVNIRSNDGATALMHAAGQGREDVVRMLLEREDVQVDCRDNSNETALMRAYRYGHEKAVNILETAGAPGEIPSADKRNYCFEEKSSLQLSDVV